MKCFTFAIPAKKITKRISQESFKHIGSTVNRIVMYCASKTLAFRNSHNPQRKCAREHSNKLPLEKRRQHRHTHPYSPLL